MERTPSTPGAVPAALRRALLPAIGVYLVALLIAAWPDALVPRAVLALQNDVKALFRAAHIRADATVFRGDNNPYKRKTLSIFVLGRYAGGEVSTLYRSYEGLRPEGVRIFDDVFDTCLKRMSRMREIHRLRDPSPHRRAQVVRKLRRSKMMRGISQYFARAPATPRKQHLREVLTVWFYESTDYRTGEDFPMDAVVHRYDVRRDSSGRGAFPGVRFDGDDPVLELR
ncbi:MAG: hypothetical protein OXT09_04535 [Myxococcales bacterium]|nr:hypothetical protein [Myxococcales bacterium]